MNEVTIEDHSQNGNSSSTELSEEEDAGEDGSGSHLSDLGLRETKRAKYEEGPDDGLSASVYHQVDSSKVEQLCKIFKGELLETDDIRGRGGNSSWKFRCANDHEFVITTCKLS